MTAHAIDDTRLVVRVLADQVAAGKPRALTQAHSLIPLLCPPLTALDLFDDLCAAVGRGDKLNARRLLDQLCGGEA